MSLYLVLNDNRSMEENPFLEVYLNYLFYVLKS